MTSYFKSKQVQSFRLSEIRLKIPSEPTTTDMVTTTILNITVDNLTARV